jgi:glycosyltransferase involved in cell wall biosynthesis
MVIDLVSTIIRFHDSKRVAQLDQALFSLSLQTHSQVQIILVTQNATPSTLESLHELLKKHVFSDSNHKILNITVPENKDARSDLLNEGISAADGQYLAFLDYDDVIYQINYQTLIDRLKLSGAPVAVGGCRIGFERRVTDDAGKETLYIESKRNYLFETKNKLDLFYENFIPIHSYLIDRKRVDPSVLHFNSNLIYFEDYEFLLRLGSRYEFDFAALSTPLVEYRIRNDNTNSIPAGGADASKRELWEHSKGIVDSLKQNLVVQARALEIAELVRERDQLREERKAISFRIAAKWIAWSNQYPKLKAMSLRLLKPTAKFAVKVKRKLTQIFRR